MSLGFFGGIAGAYQAIQKGVDDAKYRDEVDLERERRKSDRAYLDGQRERTIKEQQRADRRLEGYRGVVMEGDELPGTPDIGTLVPDSTKPPPAQTSTMDATPADGVDAPGAKLAAPAAPAPKPQPRRQTYSGMLRDLAKVERADGDPMKAAELAKTAQAWDIDMAGKRLNSIIASADAMSPDELAKTVAEMYNSDPLPTQVRNLKANPDGSFTGTVYGTESRKEMPVQFKSKAEMLRGLQALYQPEHFQKLQQSAIEAANKTHDVPPGSKIIRGDGTVVGSNDAEPAAVQAARIRAAAGGRAGGTGTGTGKGTKVADPIKDAADAVLDQATKGEIKLQPSQLSDAQMRAAQIAARGVPMYVAANVAIKVAQDPSVLKPRLDPATGMINTVYEDQAVGEVTVDRGVASARNPKGLTKEQLKGFAGQIVESQPPEAREKLVAAAFDPTARRDVESGLTIEINKMFDAKIAENPNAKAQLEAQKKATIVSSIEALGRKLDMINGHYPKPKAPGEAPKRSLFSGGLSGGDKYVPPADSPAGKMRAAADQRAQADAEKKRVAGIDTARKAEAALKAAQPVIQSGDVQAAYKLQSSPEFDFLPQKEKLEIYKIVNGIRR